MNDDIWPGPGLRQNDLREETTEKQKGQLKRKDDGLRRRHERSRAGHPPEPKADLLSLSTSLSLLSLSTSLSLGHLILDGCWFSTLSCFLASPLGVTRVLFSCVAFVPLLVWVENYKNKWLVWLHCGVRNLIEWRLCLSLNQDWYLAGDGWCYVTVLRWLTWFYFGSKRSTWGQGDGGMLGSWMLGINRGGVFSILGYMDLNGFSALCVWYGFGFQMVSMETLEAGFGRMRFIYKPGVFLIVCIGMS
ncbi:hypothetical protein DY000_02041049 [Brassica cretica]|uniref:Uncharacterized protein n=1 Tax=Brassica cretica TaxID=69181 RepID=A0ABQ7BSG4_BRACR|nr:hypothetical protein DY000_02041049 [Brassica cretica]